MKYGTEVEFVQEVPAGYDYNTGNQNVARVDVDIIYANVTGQTIERQKLLYGVLDENALVIRVQNGYDKPFNYVVVHGKRYDLTATHTHRRDQVFFVRGVAKKS